MWAEMCLITCSYVIYLHYHTRFKWVWRLLRIDTTTKKLSSSQIVTFLKANLFDYQPTRFTQSCCNFFQNLLHPLYPPPPPQRPPSTLKYFYLMLLFAANDDKENRRSEESWKQHQSHQKVFQSVCLVVNVEKHERWAKIKANSKLWFFQISI